MKRAASIFAACAAFACASCGPQTPPESVMNAMPTAGVVPPPEDAGPPRTGIVPNADNVIASLRPRFRACFSRGLDIDPHLDGSVDFTVDIGADGSVTQVERASVVGLTEDLVTCLSNVISSAHFDPPAHGHGRLDVPVHLKQQN